MEPTSGQLYADEYFEYLQNRSKFRKGVRRYYLQDISKYCIGPTIDFGCGIGELLKTLPEGSVGFEVNQVLVDFCKKAGMPVEYYIPEADEYRFKMIKPAKYTSFTMNHVLEHLEDSSTVIRQIFKSCNELGISRIVFTVPGYKGYLSDKTHRTFIDRKYFKDHGLFENIHYQLKLSKYFPVNSEKFGHYFTHNELRFVFDKTHD